MLLLLKSCYGDWVCEYHSPASTEATFSEATLVFVPLGGCTPNLPTNIVVS